MLHLLRSGKNTALNTALMTKKRTLRLHLAWAVTKMGQDMSPKSRNIAAPHLVEALSDTMLSSPALSRNRLLLQQAVLPVDDVPTRENNSILK